MKAVDKPRPGAPRSVAMFDFPCMERQVYLVDPSQAPPERNNGATTTFDGVNGRPVVWATSWWDESTAESCIQDRSKPIWASLAEARMELYREISSVYCGSFPELESAFGATGPFWGRDYIFWHRGAPLTIIQEVFSSGLQTYLGPMHAAQGLCDNA